MVMMGFVEITMLVDANSGRVILFRLCNTPESWGPFLITTFIVNISMQRFEIFIADGEVRWLIFM